jgi:hypothetical protein
MNIHFCWAVPCARCVAPLCPYKVRDCAWNTSCVVLRHCCTSNLVDTLSAGSELSLHYLFLSSPMPFGMYHTLADLLVGWLRVGLSERASRRKRQNLVASGCISKACFSVRSSCLLEYLAVLWSDFGLILWPHSTFSLLVFYVTPPCSMQFVLCWSRQIFISSYAY